MRWVTLRVVRQLSPLDVQFLNVETDTTFAHVGALVLLDPSGAEGGVLTLDAVRGRIAERLPALGPFRWKLHPVPLGVDLPYWEEVEPDLTHHVREVGVPAPGDDEALCAVVGELASVPLDRDHPLWQTTLLTGLAGGRAAIYLKVHHAAVDGVSVADVLGVLTDEAGLEDGAGAGSMTGESAGGAPSLLGALGRSAWNAAARTTRLARSAPALLPHLLDLPGATGVPGVGSVVGVLGAVGRAAGIDVPGADTPSAPDTVLNGPITAPRGLGVATVPLATVKQVKDALGLTVNDVVLAMATTALREWLGARDALPERPLVAAVPVSVRTPEQQGRGGNQVSIMLVELPTTEPDALTRARVLHESVVAAKERFAELPPTLLEEWAAALPQVGGGLASRAVMGLAGVRAPVFTLFVSNVPGPQRTLHCAGATVLALHPVSAVSEVGGAVNITVMSYDGNVDVGVVVARDTVPDVDVLTASLVTALDELVEATR